jgi:hypothetical protein
MRRTCDSLRRSVRRARLGSAKGQVVVSRNPIIDSQILNVPLPVRGKDSSLCDEWSHGGCFIGVGELRQLDIVERCGANAI